MPRNPHDLACWHSNLDSKVPAARHMAASALLEDWADHLDNDYKTKIKCLLICNRIDEIVEMGEKIFIDLFQSFYNEYIPPERIVKAIHGIGFGEEKLIEMLSDENWRIRGGAVKSLAVMGVTEGQLIRIIQMLKSNKWQEVEAAELFLKKIAKLKEEINLPEIRKMLEEALGLGNYEGMQSDSEAKKQGIEFYRKLVVASRRLKQDMQEGSLNKDKLRIPGRKEKLVRMRRAVQ